MRRLSCCSLSTYAGTSAKVCSVVSSSVSSTLLARKAQPRLRCSSLSPCSSLASVLGSIPSPTSRRGGIELPTGSDRSTAVADSRTGLTPESAVHNDKAQSHVEPRERTCALCQVARACDAAHAYAPSSIRRPEGAPPTRLRRRRLRPCLRVSFELEKNHRMKRLHAERAKRGCEAPRRREDRFNSEDAKTDSIPKTRRPIQWEGAGRCGKTPRDRGSAFLGRAARAWRLQGCGTA